MVIVPLRVPAAVGTNFTVMVHWSPALSEVPQLLVSVKSPPATMLVRLSVEVPVFFSVTVFDELVVLTCCRAKVRLAGDRLTVVVPEVVPVPVRVTTCGLPAALSVIVIVPGWLPVAVGVNVTLIVQFPPAATEAPQVLVCEYAALAAMLVMLNEAVPVLVSVTGCAVLDVFTTWLPKLKVVGDKLTAGAVVAVPVPDRPTV
jgi:hypothetical protein